MGTRGHIELFAVRCSKTQHLQSVQAKEVRQTMNRDGYFEQYKCVACKRWHFIARLGDKAAGSSEAVRSDGR